MLQDKYPDQATGSKLSSQNRPASRRRRRQAAALSLAVGISLALAIIIAFYCYGEFSHKMSNPEALYLGIFIGGLNLTVFILVQARRLSGHSWTGLVINKSIQIRGIHTIYTILVQGPGGRKKRIHFPDDAEKFAFYKLGDQVRYHSGWSFLEKTDSKADLFTYCFNCGQKCSHEAGICAICSWPL